MARVIDRRAFLKVGGSAVGVTLAASVPGPAAGAAPRPRFSYYPKGAPFRSLYVIDSTTMSTDEGVLVGTLQGLAARVHDHPHVYVSSPNSAYVTWLDDLRDHYGVTVTPVRDAWDLLARYRAGATAAARPAHYLLYSDADGSVSVATTLAGLTGALAVSETIEDQATAAGLRRLMDVRGRDDAWVRANYWSDLRHDVILEQKPTFSYQLRDYATMSRSMLFYDGNSDLREQLVTALDDDSPVIGWGDASHGEDAFVSPSSKAGAFTIAADWATNVSTLSGVSADRLTQRSPGRDVGVESGVHYVTFMVTDGDNVQWLLGSLQNDAGWFASPLRGTLTMGWGISPSLIDLAPSAMRWYYDHESTGAHHDEFVVGPSGGGYLYPSQFPAKTLDLHTSRLDDYMGRADLRVVQILDFNAFDRTDVWDSYTARSSIAGLVYLEYSRYDSLGGAVRWSRGKPVISARHMLWDGLDGADEASVVSGINAAPRDPSSVAGYTVVMVHAWSKKLANVKTVVDQLATDVRVVTPTAFTRLMTANVAH